MDLISVINKLQDVFNIGFNGMIQLPQIVVIGAQSSGKSSVLENIVKAEIFPRGTGMVTRRPLILQLIRTNNEEVWGEFRHVKNKKFTSFDEIRKEIEEETERSTGNKGVSKDPIRLQIFSPEVLTLTLVDLPGITKVPVADQPIDIEQQIKEMIMEFINNPNSIILVVSPANTDFSTCEALKLARDADPHGVRTIAVVSKLDIMDKGTDAYDVLCGKVIPVKLGIVGVINRSQLQINKRKPFDEVRKDEALFLKNNYPEIANKNGIGYLHITLEKLLMHQIRRCLPSLKENIDIKESEFISKVNSFGKPLEEVEDKIIILQQLITKFVTASCCRIEGTAKNFKIDKSSGAKISYIFREKFRKDMESLVPLGELTKEEILTTIKFVTGTRPNLFYQEVTELLIKKQIRRLEEPSIRCVKLVHDDLQRIFKICMDDTELLRFPRLNEKIGDVVTDLLKKSLTDTNKMVINLIHMELAYINIYYPDFDTNNLSQNQKAFKFYDFKKDPSRDSVQNNQNSNNLFLPNESINIISHREQQECENIERLISSNFPIIRKNIEENVPKAIMHFLVNNVKENLQSELFFNISRTSYDEILQESLDIDEKRQKARQTLNALQKAKKIVNEIENL